MKSLILLILGVLLTACNLDVPSGIRPGREFEIIFGARAGWNDHKLEPLVTALDACAEKPTILPEECLKRYDEAWSLITGALSCKKSAMPACVSLTHEFGPGGFAHQDWLRIATQIGAINHEDRIAPVELNTLLWPENDLLRSTWTMADRQMVLLNRLSQYEAELLLGTIAILLTVLAGIAWRRRQAARTQALEARALAEEALREHQRTVESARAQALELALRFKRKKRDTLVASLRCQLAQAMRENADLRLLMPADESSTTPGNSDSLASQINQAIKLPVRPLR